MWQWLPEGGIEVFSAYLASWVCERDKLDNEDSSIWQVGNKSIDDVVEASRRIVQV
jgi:hypothetical protein